MRAMMAHTGLQKNLMTGLWLECGTTTTKIENMMVNPHKEKCAYYRKNFRNFVEIGVVRIISTVKDKLED